MVVSREQYWWVRRVAIGGQLVVHGGGSLGGREKQRPEGGRARQRDGPSCASPSRCLLHLHGGGRGARKAAVGSHTCLCPTSQATASALASSSYPLGSCRAGALSYLVLGIGPGRAGTAQAHRASGQKGSGLDGPKKFRAVPCQPKE